jgi:hypothetical protein
MPMFSVCIVHADRLWSVFSASYYFAVGESDALPIKSGRQVLLTAALSRNSTVVPSNQTGILRPLSLKEFHIPAGRLTCNTTYLLQHRRFIVTSTIALDWSDAISMLSGKLRAAYTVGVHGSSGRVRPFLGKPPCQCHWCDRCCHLQCFSGPCRACWRKKDVDKGPCLSDTSLFWSWCFNVSPKEAVLNIHGCKHYSLGRHTIFNCSFLLLLVRLKRSHIFFMDC